MVVSVAMEQISLLSKGNMDGGILKHQRPDIVLIHQRQDRYNNYNRQKLAWQQGAKRPWGS